VRVVLPERDFRNCPRVSGARRRLPCQPSVRSETVAFFSGALAWRAYRAGQARRLAVFPYYLWEAYSINHGEAINACHLELPCGQGFFRFILTTLY